MDSNKSISVRNGRDLAANILNHPKGGIGALLRFVATQETEWLEFKAAIYPVSGFETGEKEDDYRWNLVKAVIAMANGIGGAVILGLNDNGEAVGLTPSDPKGILASQGREKFNRKIVKDSLVRQSWKTGLNGVFTLDGCLESLIEIRNFEYQELPVTVVLVSPVPEGQCLEVCQLFNNHKTYITFARAHGDQGEVLKLQSQKEIRVHEQTRNGHLQDSTYQHFWQQFLDSCQEDSLYHTSLDIDPSVEKDLYEYCSKITDNVRAFFTPLDAEEWLCNTSSISGFEPEAVEIFDIFATDDPWDSINPPGKESISLENQSSPEPEDAIACIPRYGGVFELLEQEPQAVLLGEPGSGKTTCLQRLTLDAAANYKEGGIFTLFVPLRNLTSTGLQRLLESVSGQSWPILDKLIRLQRLRLFLDAINECPRHLQTRCCQEIHELLNTYQKIPMVVSARSSTFCCSLQRPVFVLRPLDSDQQHRFLTAYLGDILETA
jgi:hypothetical protein